MMEIGEVAASLAVSEEDHKIVIMIPAERTGVTSNQLEKTLKQNEI